MKSKAGYRGCQVGQDTGFRFPLGERTGENTQYHQLEKKRKEVGFDEGFPKAKLNILTNKM